MSKKPLYFTVEQARERLERLLNLGRRVQNKFEYHSTGPEYTSLMVSFLLEEMSSAETLLRLAKSFGNEWFPINIGYMIARSMFEIDVSAHYIAVDKVNRSHQYIEYVHVLRKNELDAIIKHKDTDQDNWRQFLQLWFKHDWENRAGEIIQKFNETKHHFEENYGRGKKKRISQNWSGKSIKQMAKEVEHELEYDISYARLSSFVHGNIKMADRFLKADSSGPFWTLKSEDYEVGFVFDYSATFFDCFLRLFGNEFKLWTEEDVNSCWKVDDVNFQNNEN